MKIIKVFTIAALLLTAVQAHATSTVFNIFFRDTRSRVEGENGFAQGHLVGLADFQGTYIITDGLLTAFSAQIGECLPGLVTACLYNFLDTGFNSDPGAFGQDGFGGVVYAQPRLSRGVSYNAAEHKWATGSNTAETIGANFDRVGIYRVEATVPELSPAWLLIIGAALIATNRYARRR